MKMRNIAYLSALSAIAFGCSIINAPEELSDDTAEAGDGDGDGDMMTGDGDMGGSTGDGDGDMTPGDGDMGDGDMTVDPPEPPTSGLIVVAGTEADSGDRVLLTLAASNGEELDREELPATSIAYDEKPGRYLWFILKTSQTDPGANTLAELEVRRFDDETNTWTEISKVGSLPAPLVRGNEGANPGPTPTATFRPVVLNNRLAYISQVNDGGTVQAVTVLDTSDIENVTLQESITIPGSGNQALGLVGLRGTDLDSEADGGSVTVLTRGACMGGGDPICNLEAYPYSISNNVMTLTDTDFGPFQGVPAFTSTPVLPDSVDRPFDMRIRSLGAYGIAFEPDMVGGGDPRWVAFDPSNPAMVSNQTSVAGSSSTSFSAFAVSECLAAGVAGDATTQELYSIHMGNASVQTASPALGDIARDVLIEPFRDNALTLRSTGAEQQTVRAFQIEQIGGVGNERITLTERTIWNAPDDVDPHTFAVRLPEENGCL